MNAELPVLLIDLGLLTGMMVMVVAIIRMRNLFAVTMISGVYSLFAAAFFVNLDAVDVAFTEAAVGAGISTVLMMGAIALTSQREKPGHTHPVMGLAVVFLVGGMLIYGTLDLPAFNSENPVTRNDIYEEYVYGSIEKLHIPNMVTSVLASYRGYDTLGEVAVIFTAGVGVTMLLGSSLLRRRPRKMPGRKIPLRKALWRKAQNRGQDAR